MRGGSMRTILRGTTLLVAVLLLGACGSEEDACQECTSADTCPSLFQTCPGYTATVQSCSGGCCVKNASEVSCTSLEAAGGHYFVVDGVVQLEPEGRSCGLHVWIDPVANGWVDANTAAAERRGAIDRHMAEIMPNARPR